LVTLQLDPAAPLSGGLADQVAAACAVAEEEQTPLLVRLPGADPDELRLDGLDVHTVTRWERTVRRLEQLPVVTLTVADGVCQGPALDLLLATDHRIAAPDTRLRVVLINGSTWPGMSLYRLAHQLGLARARQAALFGVGLPARQAADWGLLDEVVADIEAGTRAALARLSGINGREFAIRRRLLAEAPSTTFDDALGAHLAACDRTLRLAGGAASPVQ
jgi:isomerase DpgB